MCLWVSAPHTLQTHQYPLLQKTTQKECPGVIRAFMLSLCSSLCFTSEIKRPLPTSGCKSTFIFDFIIQLAGICHMILVSEDGRIQKLDSSRWYAWHGHCDGWNHRYAGSLGVSVLVSGGRITAHFYPESWSFDVFALTIGSFSVRTLAGLYIGCFLCSECLLS